MPPTQLDNYRMLTPQAHPMNDGLSLYPPTLGPFLCRRLIFTAAGARYSIALTENLVAAADSQTHIRFVPVPATARPKGWPQLTPPRLLGPSL